jgi:hypothetical protein
MILSRKSTRDLQVAVEQSIRNGFQPHGSIAVERVVPDKLNRGVQASHTMYYHPMVIISGIN